MSTVNERAVRRWEAERDRRIMAAWDALIAGRQPWESQTWMKQVDEILSPLTKERR